MLGLQLKFGAARAPPPPPAVAPPSFMVFFDWDRSNLSAQALNTIKQAARLQAKGNARITATGHTDKSGPEAYNMALSLRRANAVKDALVREGVPATAIAVIGRGEAGRWCRPPTACASRRTAASRSSSSKRSAYRLSGRPGKCPAVPLAPLVRPLPPCGRPALSALSRLAGRGLGS